jgi:hypothetical protein
MGLLRRLLFGNLLLKAAALLCGGVLWVYADGFVEVERRIGAAVLLPELERGRCRFAETGERAARVTATVRGPARTVRKIERGDIVALLDESAFWFAGSAFSLEAPPSAGTIELSPEQFTVRRVGGVEIVEVAPPCLWVTFERSAGQDGRPGGALPVSEDPVVAPAEEVGQGD